MGSMALGLEEVLFVSQEFRDATDVFRLLEPLQILPRAERDAQAIAF